VQPDLQDLYLISGKGPVPKESVLYESIPEIGLMAVVDIRSNRLVRAEFKTVFSLYNEFLVERMVGYDLSRGIDALVRDIEEHVMVQSKKAVIRAIQQVYEKYVSLVKESERCDRE
jgi:hypothetical protein